MSLSWSLDDYDDHESSSAGSEDTASESDEFGCEKVAAGIAFNFGLSNVGKTRITSLETDARYFVKGYHQASRLEMVPEPRANDAVVF
jgi:hypothetical protein